MDPGRHIELLVCRVSFNPNSVLVEKNKNCSFMLDGSAVEVSQVAALGIRFFVAVTYNSGMRVPVAVVQELGLSSHVSWCLAVS